MLQSKNYKMNMPELPDQYNVKHWNDNTEIIDNQMKVNADAIVTEKSRAMTAEENIQNNISNGTTIAKKAEQDKNGNIIATTYATKTELSTEISRATQSENSIKTNISNGTTIVKKAEQDSDGNAINTTYVKKSNIIDSAHGGSGKATLKESANTFINSLDNGTADMTDNASFITTDSSSDTKVYYKRSSSYIWNWIKSKISSVLGLTSSSYGGKASTAGSADTLKEGGHNWKPNYDSTNVTNPDWLCSWNASANTIEACKRSALNVNYASSAGSAGNSSKLNGKTEGSLNVNYANSAGSASSATTANYLNCINLTFDSEAIKTIKKGSVLHIDKSITKYNINIVKGEGALYNLQNICKYNIGDYAELTFDLLVTTSGENFWEGLGIVKYDYMSSAYSHDYTYCIARIKYTTYNGILCYAHTQYHWAERIE